MQRRGCVPPPAGVGVRYSLPRGCGKRIAAVGDVTCDARTVVVGDRSPRSSSAGLCGVPTGVAPATQNGLPCPTWTKHARFSSRGQHVISTGSVSHIRSGRNGVRKRALLAGESFWSTAVRAFEPRRTSGGQFGALVFATCSSPESSGRHGDVRVGDDRETSTITRPMSIETSASSPAGSGGRRAAATWSGRRVRSTHTCKTLRDRRTRCRSRWSLRESAMSHGIVMQRGCHHGRPSVPARLQEGPSPPRCRTRCGRLLESKAVVAVIFKTFLTARRRRRHRLMEATPHIGSLVLSRKTDLRLGRRAGSHAPTRVPSKTYLASRATELFLISVAGFLRGFRLRRTPPPSRGADIGQIVASQPRKDRHQGWPGPAPTARTMMLRCHYKPAGSTDARPPIITAPKFGTRSLDTRNDPFTYPARAGFVSSCW